MINVADSLKDISSALRACGIEDADKESELIFTKGTGFNRLALYRDHLPLSEEQSTEISALLKRRIKREPLQYIIGHVEFYGLKIKVGPGVLIPRPETELLVEEAIRIVKRGALNVKRETKNSSLCIPHSAFHILDICTGSGCIALSLAKHFPEADVYGTDISEKALEYAHENAQVNKIENVMFRKGNLYEPVADMKFDIIVSNPPYIRRPDLANLQPEIKRWEPTEALDGGSDGLEFYRKILSGGRKYINSNGFLLLEIGQGQAQDVIKTAEDSGLKCVSIIKDYSGIERHLCLKILDF